MSDRFESTAVDAAAAIERARGREILARRRRQALDERIAELDGSYPPHRTADERAYAAEALERAARAAESSDIARRRAERAQNESRRR